MGRAPGRGHDPSADRRWRALRIADLWAYRELLYFLTKRELQIRYKQSLFGITWAVLQPLALAFIFTIFFGVLAEVPSEGLPYPLFALAGLVPWLFVSQTVSQAAASLVGDANLLSKVYFPRLVLPAGSKRASLLARPADRAGRPDRLRRSRYGEALGGRALLALPAFLALAVGHGVGARRSCSPR